MIKRFIRFIFRLCIGLFILSLALVILFKWVAVPVTPLMVIRSFEQSDTEFKFWKHQWVPLEEISTNLQLAVICSEDQNFLTHKGFDLKAIEKAIENNKKGKRIKGASTISQQTAKNVFLWPQRSWFRKGLETYFTFLIELLWSKERIMEVYLNSIEMGPGVYGAEAASNYWFKTTAKRLNRDQSSALAAILPNPLKYKANPASLFIEQRKTWIKGQMNIMGTKLQLSLRLNKYPMVLDN